MAGVKIKVSTEEAQTAVKKLRQDLSQLGLTTEEVDNDVKKLESRLIKKVGADKAKSSIDSLTKSLGLSRNEVRKLEKEFGTAESTFTKIGRSAKSLGVQLGITFTALGAIGIGKKMFSLASDYESALIDMRKVTDASYADIRKTISQLGPELGTQTELMKGYYSIMSAGIKDPVKAFDMLKTASEVALSQHMEQQEVVKSLTSLMFGYGGAIKSASEASDLLFAIDAAGKTSVAELVPVIGDLASISKQAGLSADEMGAAMAVLSQTAGSTSQAATQLQSILVGLIRPQEMMTELLKKMGVESGAALVQSVGFSKALMMVKQAAADAGVPIGKFFRSSEALIGLGPMLGSNMKEFDDRLGEIANKAGLAAQANKEFSGSAESASVTLKNTIAGVMKDLGETILPAVVAGMRDVQTFLSENKDAFKYFADSIIATWNGFPAGVLSGAAVGIIAFMFFGVTGTPALVIAGLVAVEMQLRQFGSGITQLPEKVALARKSLDDLWASVKLQFADMPNIGSYGSDIASDLSKKPFYDIKFNKWLEDFKKSSARFTKDFNAILESSQGMTIPLTTEELKSQYDKAKSLAENYYKELDAKIKQAEIEMKLAGKTEEEINKATLAAKATNIDQYYAKEKALIVLEANARSDSDKEKLSVSQFTADKMVALDSEVALKRKNLSNEELANDLKVVENKKKQNQEVYVAEMKQFEDLEKSNADYLDNYKKERKEALKDHKEFMADESDFAISENERAVNAIIAGYEEKEREYKRKLDKDLLTQEEYDEAIVKLNKEKNTAVEAQERENAKKIADMNYELISEIKGYEKEAYDARMKQIDADAAKKLAEGANWQYVEQWKKKETLEAYTKMGEAGDDFFAGVKAGAAQMIKDFKSVGTLGFEFMQSSFEALTTTVETFFGDLFKGELKSFSDYWSSFCDSMLAAFAKMIAQLISQWLIFEATVALFGENFASSLGLTGGGLSKLFGSSGGGLLGGIVSAVGSFVFNKILGGAVSWIGEVTGLSEVFSSMVSWGKELIGVGAETVSSMSSAAASTYTASVAMAELDASTVAFEGAMYEAGESAAALKTFTMTAELAADKIVGYTAGAYAAYAILIYTAVTLAAKFGEELWAQWTNSPGFGSTGQWEGAWSGTWGESPSSQDSSWSQLSGSSEAASSDIRDYLVNIINSVYRVVESINDSLDPAFVAQVEEALSTKTVTFIEEIGGAITPSGTINYTRETETGLTEWAEKVQTNMIDTYTGVLKDLTGQVKTVSVDTTEFNAMVNTATGDIMGGVEGLVTRITKGVETEFMGMQGGLGDIGLTASDITNPINAMLGIVTDSTDVISDVAEEVGYVSWDAANKIGDTLQDVAVSIDKSTEDVGDKVFGQIEDSITAGWEEVTVAITTQTNKWVPYLEEELRDLYPTLDDDAIEDLMNLQKALENIDSKSSVQALKDIQFALDFNDTLDEMTSGVAMFSDAVTYYMKSINEELVEGQNDAQDSAEAMMDSLKQVYDYYLKRTKETGLSVEELNNAMGDWVITMTLGTDAINEYDVAAAKMLAYWAEVGDQLIKWGYDTAKAWEIATEGLTESLRAFISSYTDSWEEDYLKLTMSEDDYLAHQIESADVIKEKLYAATDPSEIIAFAEEYAAAMDEIWQSMTDEQKKSMYGEFTASMKKMGDYLETQMAGGADLWKKIVDGTSNTYDASTATFQEAVAYFAAAVESFAGSSSSTDLTGGTGAHGGWVSGGIKGRDSVRALLMPNEFVVPADVAERNASMLESMRSGSKYARMAAGGWVGMADGGFVGDPNPDYTRTVGTADSSDEQSLADSIAKERAKYRLTLMELEWNHYMDLAEEAYTHEMNLLKLSGASSIEVSLDTLEHKKSLYEEDYEKQKEIIELTAELRTDDEREVLSDAEYINRELVKLEKSKTLAFTQFANERELLLKTEIADREELLKQMEYEKKELEIENKLKLAQMEYETLTKEAIASEGAEGARAEHITMWNEALKYKAEYQSAIEVLNLQKQARTEDERRLLSDEEWMAQQMFKLNAERDMKLYEFLQRTRRFKAQYGIQLDTDWASLLGFSEGGWVRGGVAGKDSVLALLQPNEFVVSEKQAGEYASLLELIQSGRIYGSRDGVSFGSAVSSKADKNIDSTMIDKGRPINVTLNLNGTVIDRKAVDEFAKTIYPRLDRLRRLGH